jgi:hypothetical protein
MANKKPKKPIVEVGDGVPRSLKFAIMVAIAILWAQFLRTWLLDYFSDVVESHSVVVVDFSVAVIATIIGYIILIAYRKIMNGMKKVKV